MSGIHDSGTGGYLELDIIDIRGGDPAVVGNGTFESATANPEPGVCVVVRPVRLPTRCLLELAGTADHRLRGWHVDHGRRTVRGADRVHPETSEF